MTPLDITITIISCLIVGLIIGDTIGWWRGRRRGIDLGKALGRLEGYTLCRDDYNKHMGDFLYEQQCEIAANKGIEKDEDGEGWKGP